MDRGEFVSLNLARVWLLVNRLELILLISKGHNLSNGVLLRDDLLRRTQLHLGWLARAVIFFRLLPLLTHSDETYR